MLVLTKSLSEYHSQPVFQLHIGNRNTAKICHNVNAIIDTGSYYSFVKEIFAIELGATFLDEAVSFQPINTSSKSSNQTALTLVIDELETEVEINLCIQEEIFDKIDVILGTNFLKHFEFHYNGAQDCFSLGKISV